MAPCFLCGLHSKWVVEDVVSGHVRAACREHVTLALFSRSNLVTEYDENGLNMIEKKKQLNASIESESRRNTGPPDDIGPEDRDSDKKIGVRSSL